MVKIDHLHEFVSNVYSDLDIIAITETSHKVITSLLLMYL